MKVLLLTNSEIKKSSHIKSIANICDLTVLDIKKTSLVKFSLVDLVIILTYKIISKKSTDYKKVSSFIKNKKVKMIEIAFLKSNIEKVEASSSAIIHGLGDLTWEAIEKIVKTN